MISNEALEEFRNIWREEFCEDISDAEALEQATKLITLMNVVYKPLKKNGWKKLEEMALSHN